jgi:hypothetical protein
MGAGCRCIRIGACALCCFHRICFPHGWLTAFWRMPRPGCLIRARRQQQTPRMEHRELPTGYGPHYKEAGFRNSLYSGPDFLDLPRDDSLTAG